MRVVKGNDQQRDLIVLGAIINDTQVLHSVVVWNNQYPDDLFLSETSQRIVKWCLTHYEKNREAPGSHLLRVQYYEPWEEKVGGGVQCEAVEKLRLRVEQAWTNTKFRKDQLFEITEEVLRRQQVVIASDRMGGSSSATNVSDIIPGATPVSLTREPEFDSLFHDPNVGSDIANLARPVFEFPNEVVNRFFDDTFAPSTFVTFLAPEKRGKSQWLLECTIAALASKKTVLYFDAGDMTDEQIFLRFAARAMGKPYKPGPWYQWNDLTLGPDNTPTFDVETIEYEDHITQEQANKIKRKYAKHVGDRFFSRNFPRGMLTISTMRSILDSLSIRGVQVDVMIVDYADILGASKTKYQDNRHAITEIWGDLRSLSQSYELALITATQSNAASYSEELSEKSFSESKTKRAFITAEIGIDKTEVHESIFKLSYTFRRTGSRSRSIYVASDLATYKPAVKAMWVPKRDEVNSRIAPKFRKK